MCRRLGDRVPGSSVRASYCSENFHKSEGRCGRGFKTQTDSYSDVPRRPVSNAYVDGSSVSSERFYFNPIRKAGLLLNPLKSAWEHIYRCDQYSFIFKNVGMQTGTV